jgi:hypothetical protein
VRGSASRQVILIHGLPQRGCDDPIEDQLGEVCRLCESQGFAVAPYRWADCSSLSAARALARMRRTDRSFLDEEAARFGAWMSRETHDIPQDVHLVVIAYSAGGAIFYRWLVSAARVSERLALAVTIAAPHTVPNPVYFEDELQVGYEVNEPEIDSAGILARLAAPAPDSRSSSAAPMSPSLSSTLGLNLPLRLSRSLSPSPPTSVSDPIRRH